MESNFRFGIIERLTVAAFVAGVFGVVASVSLPAPYQEYLAHSGWGPVLFGVSFAVILSSALFFICDLALYIATKRGVKLGTALVFIGFGLIILGAIVGLKGAWMMDAAKEAELQPKLEHPPPRPAVVRRYTVFELERRQKCIEAFMDFVTGPATDMREQAQKTVEAWSSDDFQSQRLMLKDKSDVVDRTLSKLLAKYPDYAEVTGISDWNIPGRTGFNTRPIFPDLSNLGAKNPIIIQQLQKSTMMSFFWVQGKTGQLRTKREEYNKAEVLQSSK